MADQPISAMPVAAQVTNEDLIPIVQSGVNYSATRSRILTGAVGEGITLESASNEAAQLSTPTGDALVQVIPVAETAVVKGNDVQIVVPNTSLTMQASGGYLFSLVFSSTGTIYIGDSASQVFLTLDAATKEGNLFCANGLFLSYSPTVPASWNGLAPTNVQQALDRCAALLKILNGGVGP